MNVLEKLIFYWNYPFVRYALIVGVLIALCSSLLGVTLVLKRFPLSEMAFLMWRSAAWPLRPCWECPTICR